MIIDFHTHCFSPAIAAHAMESLTKESVYPARYDGTLPALKACMQEAGVDYSVVLNIATSPRQMQKVNDWAIDSNGGNIISFGSLHPFGDWKPQLRRLKETGIKGVKFHPDYQGFDIDCEEAYKMYEGIAGEDMIISFHCGHDLFVRKHYCATPQAFMKVIGDFRGAKMIGAHLGGQDMKEDVFRYVAGKDVYVDTSFAFKLLTQEEIDRFLAMHDGNKILFGTDMPWQLQKTEVKEMRTFVKDKTLLDKIFYRNAAKLLGI